MAPLHGRRRAVQTAQTIACLQNQKEDYSNFSCLRQGRYSDRPRQDLRILFL